MTATRQGDHTVRFDWGPTGGLAVVIAPETKLIAHVDVELTLQGLRIVWDRNTKC